MIPLPKNLLYVAKRAWGKEANHGFVKCPVWKCSIHLEGRAWSFITDRSGVWANEPLAVETIWMLLGNTPKCQLPFKFKPIDSLLPL